MTIYIVSGVWDYEGSCALKAFKSLEKAEVYAQAAKEDAGLYFDDFEIQEMILED